MDDALIAPDDPIPERSDSFDDALISPDDPIPQHDPVTDPVRSGSGNLPELGDSAGVVTGMDHDAHVAHEDMVAARDPHVMELVRMVAKLSEGLKQKGEAALRISGEMDRFESTLRGYCVGYLAGRRADEDRAPEY